jgi:hypothetical protein
MTPAIQHLELRDEGWGQNRHYIGDVAIHCGDPIRAEIGGEWFDGRYEATFTHGRVVVAWFYFGEDEAAQLTEQVPVALPGGDT